jgi:hypothetical protein
MFVGDEIVARAIFQLEFELRRRGEALNGRMTEEFVFRLADYEVQ